MFWNGATRSDDSSERMGLREFPRACWSESTGESARLVGNCNCMYEVDIVRFFETGAIEKAEVVLKHRA
jgi:predicted oxidoreductase